MKRLLIFSRGGRRGRRPGRHRLVGNASFAQTVPVRVPSQARAQTVDDKGGQTTHAEPGDDKAADQHRAG